MVGKLVQIRREERGASLVELALVLFLLVLLVAGIADVGRAFNSYMVIVNASREGARYASRFPHDDTGIEGAVKAEAASSSVPPGDIGIAVGNLGGKSGEEISVTATYDFPTLFGSILGTATIPMNNTTRMVIFGVGPD
jgi:Flp pilus assembly protein TadG